MQVELDARVVLEHLEADGVLAAEEFLLRVDANIEVVEEQIVIGAIGSVLAAQDIGVGGDADGWRRAGRREAAGHTPGKRKRRPRIGINRRVRERRREYFANRTARRMDCATASAAATPRVLISACSAPSESAKATSPSTMVFTG